MKTIINIIKLQKPSSGIYCNICMLFFILCVFGSSHLHAQTVTSLSALQTAINSAGPGDVITLANGIYTASTEITITRQGTASQPITIQAQSIGGAEIRGSGGFQLNSPAKYIIIKGFKLTHATGTMSISTGATFITLTRNIFECAPAGTGNKAYLSISGDDNEISYNTFQNKNTEGCMLTIQGPSGNGMAQNTWIHHNLFDNFMPSGANNSSAIQSGLSSRSLSSANGIIEYNLFRNCRGENEGVVANKASDNTYRYNTISGGTELSLRHGDRMQVYGNFFMNSDGLRFCADSHKIYSNYFEGCTEAINCVNGDGDVHNGDPLTSHDRPDNVQIVFNTMVNNGSNYRMPGRTGGLGATNITFANNILLGGTSAISISGSYPNPVWSGNILWNTSGGDMPSSGYTTVNPLLAEDVNSVYHIQSGSPAIDASTGTYSFVTLDIDGQPRSGTRDVGADEFGPVPGINRPLTTADVGHNAASGTVPGAPTNLTATAVSSSQINLSWNDNSNNETQFRIERSTNAGSTWSFLANASANATTYSNTGLSTSTTYHYRVRAENATGNSSFSNIANATTQGVPIQPTYQAENAVIFQGVVESNHIGFNGTGFVNYDNVVGSYVEWNFNVASAGTYNLAIRYANASGVDRPMSITVNGTVTHSVLSFPVTTAWTDYVTVTFTASLNAGINTLRATATTASGGPNVDELQVNGIISTPPAAPSGLTATTISSTQINLSWTDNSNNEANFRIERSTDAGATWSFLTNPTANTTTFSNTGLTAATTYHYRIRAENTGGNSGFSNIANATTLPTAPVAPSGLTATAISSSQIDLSWTDNSNNEVNFRIERSTDAGATWSFLTNPSANATTFSNTGLTAGTPYHYRIRAENTGGNSGFSNIANATTLPTAPIAPSGLTATAISSSQIDLSWTDNSNNEANFRIERSTDAGATWAFLTDASANATSHSNTGLTASTTYHYRVRAENAGGNSSFSNTANATTNSGSTLQNVALNKPVTASGSDTNIPTNAVDGDNLTRWSASPMPQWLEVDLGAVFDISKTEIISYQDRAYQFIIEVKTTSTGTYTQVVNRSTNTTPGTIAAPITNTFPAVNARFVKITVTGASGYTGTWASIIEFRVFGVPVTSQSDIVFEAEDGTITSPLLIQSSASASGGQFITVAAGNNSNAAVPATGHATYNFSVVSSGTYKVWGRVICPTNSDDSFWVRVDNGTWINWNNITLGTAWVWDDVHDGVATSPVTFNLGAGSHTLEFAYREDGTQLDRIIITNNLSLDPNTTPPAGSSMARAAEPEQPLIPEQETTDEINVMSYPNPSLKESIVEFQLKKEGNVRLSLYNSATRETTLILSEHLPAGIHKTTLDVKNLPKGIHIIRLSQGRRSNTYKLIKQE